MTSPDQEMALMASGRALNEAEAKAERAATAALIAAQQMEATEPADTPDGSGPAQPDGAGASSADDVPTQPDAADDAASDGGAADPDTRPDAADDAATDGGDTAEVPTVPAQPAQAAPTEPAAALAEAEALVTASEERRWERAVVANAPAAPTIEQGGELKDLVEEVARLSDPRPPQALRDEARRRDGRTPPRNGIEELVEAVGELFADPPTTVVREYIETIDRAAGDADAGRSLDEAERGYQDEIDRVLADIERYEADARRRVEQARAHLEAFRNDPTASADDLLRGQQRLEALEAEHVAARELRRVSRRLAEVPERIRTVREDPAALLEPETLGTPSDIQVRDIDLLRRYPIAAALSALSDAWNGAEEIRGRIIAARDKATEAELRLATARAGLTPAGADTDLDALAVERQWARDGLGAATVEAALAFANEAHARASVERWFARALLDINDDDPTNDERVLREIGVDNPEQVAARWRAVIGPDKPNADVVARTLTVTVGAQLHVARRDLEAARNAAATSSVRGPLSVGGAIAVDPDRDGPRPGDEIAERDWSPLAPPAGVITVDGVSDQGEVVVHGLRRGTRVRITARPYVSAEGICWVPVAAPAIYQESLRYDAPVVERALASRVEQRGDGAVVLEVDPTTQPPFDESLPRRVMVRYTDAPMESEACAAAVDARGR